MIYIYAYISIYLLTESGKRNVYVFYYSPLAWDFLPRLMENKLEMASNRTQANLKSLYKKWIHLIETVLAQILSDFLAKSVEMSGLGKPMLTRTTGFWWKIYVRPSGNIRWRWKNNSQVSKRCTRWIEENNHLSMEKPARASGRHKFSLEIL